MDFSSASIIMNRKSTLQMLTIYTMVFSASSFASTTRVFSTRIKTATPMTTQQKFRHSQSLFSTIGDDANKSVAKEKMVNVTLETASNTKVIQVQKGEILRTSLLKRGASPHNGRSRLINCRGLGTCGTCAVEIYGNDKQKNGETSEPAIIPNERTAKEKLRLNFPPHGSADQSPRLRLACQVQVQDDITIRKRTGFWGQDTDGTLAEEYDAELWFGELEYILDNKSPRERDT